MKIKKNLWHINYIITLTAKYLQGGNINYIKRTLPVIAGIEVVKGSGRRVISMDIEIFLKIVLG